MAEPFIVEPCQAKWAQFVESDRISIAPEPFLSPNDRIFAIGSCFAEEIRKALAQLNMAMLPDYASVAIDRKHNLVDTLPERPHLNYYNSFTIRQEFERIVGEWEQAPDDHWRVRHKRWTERKAFQDPYRRLVFARTASDLNATIANLNAVMRGGFEQANVFLMTFGMIEVFVNRRNGRVVGQKPLYGGGGGAEESDFLQSGFEDNLSNVRRICDIILSRKPEARIIMTVSPVGLERTFSGKDIYVANMEGKSVLRAVLGQVEREYSQVRYFPAYELVMSNGMAGFKEDGRHVRDDVVQAIMQAFVRAHVQEGAAAVENLERNI
jgi:hypothetical protein